MSLKLQPFSTNVAANQSSNSGCVGRLPVPAEVVGVARNGKIEMPEPDAVHDGSRGQRIFHAGHPIGKNLRRPSISIGMGVFCAAASTLSTPGHTFGPLAKRIASCEHASLFQFPNGHAVRGDADR